MALLAACAGSQPPVQATQAFAHRIPAIQNYEVLYSFGNGADGANPGAALVAVSNGSGCCLYGTTQYGGKYNKGTVFSYGAAGETVLHSFGNGADGVSPQSGLVEVNGALYGTTYEGGDGNRGVVYGITTSGTQEVVYSFHGRPHGGAPDGASPDRRSLGRSSSYRRRSRDYSAFLWASFRRQRIRRYRSFHRRR